ncbi:glycoside hydrolase family 113 [Mucilaginibacter sp.]|jgi:hypothetical protein|uniref:glycoside hydrolase family 113 n=1 Tax=Mucilaginibacter sp. TaxID=1882438 RepID=UPI002CB352C0|nr:hypothetical protein [Mucilaginibacter sp.]HTI59932.1 hypothetical protein [Mucilaginibacter sp.]
MLRGINYDIGTFYRKDELSRPDFDESVIKKELEIIKNELYCDAVKITGHDTYRLSKASEFALQLGLQVWLTPSHIDATPADAAQHLVECAIAAENLRLIYGNIIFVSGFEYSIFLKGFMKGESIYERLEKMFSPVGLVFNLLGLRAGIYRKLNIYLRETTQQIRTYFKGQVTYASGTWEKINWDLFDLIGLDHYRAAYNRAFYNKQLEAYYKFNKPVVVMEFGCCAYMGAEDKGPMGWAVTEMVGERRIVKDGVVRDESVQANYITQTLDQLKQENVHAAFVFTFINPMYKHDTNPRFDLDLASFGIVKPVDEPEEGYKSLKWQPKEAFDSLALYYRQMKP